MAKCLYCGQNEQYKCRYKTDICPNPNCPCSICKQRWEKIQSKKVIYLEKVRANRLQQSTTECVSPTSNG